MCAIQCYAESAMIPRLKYISLLELNCMRPLESYFSVLSANTFFTTEANDNRMVD